MIASQRKLNNLHKQNELSIIPEDLEQYWLLKEWYDTKLEEILLSNHETKHHAKNAVRYFWLSREIKQKLSQSPSERIKAQEDKKITLEERIDTYEQQLRTFYKITSSELKEMVEKAISKEKETDDIEKILNHAIPLSAFHPRQRFLLRQLLPLKMLQLKKLQAQKTEAPKEPESLKNTLRRYLNNFFDIGKKFVDLVDDAWSAARRVIPVEIVEKVNPYLVSISGGILLAVEGILGLKRVRKAYQNKDIGERKARIAAGILTSMFGATGFGLAVTLFASAIGATVSGAALLPILVPTFVVSIYTTILVRKGYTLKCAKNAEEEAKNTYEEILSTHRKNIHSLTAQMENLQQERVKLFEQGKIASILLLKEKNLPLKEDERKTYLKYQNINQSIESCDKAYRDIYNKITSAKEHYQQCKETHLKAERKVSMNAVEVFASALVLTGAIIGSALLIASIPTGLPLAITLTGILIGVALKIFEKADEKFENKITNGIRETFIRGYDFFFPPSKKSEPEPTLAKIPSSWANIYRHPVIKPNPRSLKNEEAFVKLSQSLPNTLQTAKTSTFCLDRTPNFKGEENKVIQDQTINKVKLSG